MTHPMEERLSGHEDAPVPGRGPLATRLAALRAARELVTDRGFSVGVRDIAAAAGVDHAVVIRYFGSKAGLLDAVLTTNTHGVLAAVPGAPEAGPGPSMVRQARAGRRDALLVARACLDGRAARVRLPVVEEWVAHTTRGRPGTTDPLLAPSSSVFLAVALAAAYAVLEPYERARVGLGTERRAVDRHVARVVDEILALPGRRDAPASVAAARRPRPRPPRARPARAGVPHGRDEVRGALLDAAVDLFTRREIGAVSVRDIAKRARVNHSLLFRHFGSKEGVLRGAIERAALEVDAALAGARTSRAPLGDVVRAIRASGIPALTAQALLSGYGIEEVQSEFPAARRMVALVVADREGPTEVPPEVAVLCVTSLLLGRAVFEPALRPATGLAPDTDLDDLLGDAAHVIFDLAR
jgi:AcrR family transcriptional regulator